MFLVSSGIIKQQFVLELYVCKTVREHIWTRKTYICIKYFAFSSNKKENNGRIYFPFNINEFGQCFLEFRNAMDYFHWCFRAVLVARITMLRCLPSQNPKFARAPPDSKYITLWRRKIPLFLCTSRLMSVKVFIVFLNTLFLKYIHAVY